MLRGPKNGVFFAKIMDFAQKMALLAILRSHKKTKKQNIKNLTDQKFLNITRNIYTKNWTNRTNIEGGVGNFLWSWGTRFFGKSVKKRYYSARTVLNIWPLIFLKTQSIKTTNLHILTKFYVNWVIIGPKIAVFCLFDPHFPHFHLYN